MPKKTKIFISWTQQVRVLSVAQRLVSDLKNLSDISLWIDSVQLSVGDSFIDVMQEAIESSDYFLQIIDKNSTLKNWSNLEYLIAYAEQIKQQNLKIIKIVVSTKNKINSGLLGSGNSGVVIGLEDKNYDKGYAAILQTLNIENQDNLIDFPLDKIVHNRTIIDISSEINDKLIKHLSEKPYNLKVFDRRLFEELVAELFYGFGFVVELTKQTRDGGRDILAIKHSEVGIKYLIECKRPDPENVIGIRSVRELFGVKQDEKATKAILATTSYFSPDALQFFERNKWELEPKDFNEILKWITDYLKIKNIS